MNNLIKILTKWTRSTLQKGISLVEVLVIVTVLAIIAYALSDLLSRVFQGSDKTRLLGSIRQNGEYALNIMRDKIRNSSSVVCLSPGNDVLTVSRHDTYIRFILAAEGGANGYIAQDTPVPDPSILINTQTQANRLCDLTDAQVTSENRVFLTDNDPQTGVSLMTGTFSRIPGPTNKDTVIISFELRQAINAPNNFFNSIGGTGTESFQTTVKIR